ncbi:DUF4838 domain-containing protein [Nemorincola caseinilytica]|uniref:DUF4838 domain-containing protein n=1 Tax=Nemorincola caseinilytica TaxID=2054315 RepID=A0ABP8NPF6_9BACT
MKLIYHLAFLLVGVSACSGSAQEVTLIDGGTSTYSIVVPAEPTNLEQRSATVLQDYIKRATGMQLAIVNEPRKTTANAIYVGNTKKEGILVPGRLPDESYRLQMMGNDLVICGGSGRGLIYGVYAFIEKYIGARKFADVPAVVPGLKKLKIPADMKDESRPLFVYRETYYPALRDVEYLEWHRLQQFEDLWGLWGHSYNKLVPVGTYFKAHPEYYALVKGVRQGTQLCLSNEEVFNITVAELRKRMAANPDALYWSVSPNDDIGWCECGQCKAADDEQGTHAGSLIKFVNRVAKQFPDKRITTLAYGYTHRAPKSLEPGDNVYIFLSNIDAYRDKPLAQEGTAATFRNDVKQWGALTKNLFVWDYITQFTNYLAPFPNFLTLQPNMQYYKENGIKGVFAQGSGDTYGEWAELRCYLEARLLNNEKADVKELTGEFLQGYYGPAAKFLLQYIGQLHGNMEDSKRKLDIYGNPVNEWNSYLAPEKLNAYSEILEAAAAAVETKPIYAERVARVWLPLEYTVLQQTRFYGIEKYGVFEKDSKGVWTIKSGLKEKVARFVADCKKAKVTELSEGGIGPDAYKAEWDAIFAAGVTPSIATGAAVTLKYPFVPEYPAKGTRTLTDGTPGYNDFSYNWLGFYGTDMVATIDMGAARNMTGVKMHFLDDPRHWIFLPSKIVVEVSDDGATYRPYATIATPADEEHYAVAVTPFMAEGKTKARFVRVTATNIPALPAWRHRENKKPMIACDEIYVQ